MFIALPSHSFALQRSAMWCGDSVYMPLLTERDTFASYKHIAPPEQELRYQLRRLFGQSRLVECRPQA